MMIPERMTSAAGALGLARAAIEIAARYADRRHAFGQKIREFEGVSFQIAESVTRLDAARALVHQTARAIDARDEPGRVRRLVSESKKFATTKPRGTWRTRRCKCWAASVTRTSIRLNACSATRA